MLTTVIELIALMSTRRDVRSIINGVYKGKLHDKRTWNCGSAAAAARNLIRGSPPKAANNRRQRAKLGCSEVSFLAPGCSSVGFSVDEGLASTATLHPGRLLFTSRRRQPPFHTLLRSSISLPTLHPRPAQPSIRAAPLHRCPELRFN